MLLALPREPPYPPPQGSPEPYLYEESHEPDLYDGSHEPYLYEEPHEPDLYDGSPEPYLHEESHEPAEAERPRKHGNPSISASELDKNGRLFACLVTLAKKADELAVRTASCPIRASLNSQVIRACFGQCAVRPVPDSSPRFVRV